MAPPPHPQRLWIQFLRQALAGAPPAGLDACRAMDLAAAFCRCRAAAMFLPGQGCGLEVWAVSAALRGAEDQLGELLGPERNAASIASLSGAVPAATWTLVEIVEQGWLAPLRGLALRLECLAVSVHAADAGTAEEGFLLALWEEESPARDNLDRAQLCTLALGAGLGSAEDSKSVQAGVLRELEEMAGSDPLAGLAPHSELLRALEAEVVASGRRGEPLALVLVDTDDLAGVNRTYGPEAGDRVLRGIASILMEEAGGEGLVVRYGMEEFALLLRGGDLSDVRSRAQMIQRRVREKALPGPSGSRPSSVSVGVACLPDPLAADAESLRLKAEKALELARELRPGGLIIL